MSTAVLQHETAQPTGSPGGLAAQTAERRAKRDALEERGINPYPTRFDRSATLAELQSAHSGLCRVSIPSLRKLRAISNTRSYPPTTSRLR